MSHDDFLYKAKTKQICLIIASKVNHLMTWISTNTNHLNQVLSQNSTNYEIYHSPKLAAMTTIAQQPLLLPSPALSHFPNFSLAAKMQRTPFQLSYWSSKCMAHYNFLLLIVIPGIHSLACFALTGSLVILIKPCSILLKFFPTHCYTVSIFTTVLPCSYLMHFMQSFINIEIIYVNNCQIDKDVAYHCINVTQQPTIVLMF